MRPSWFNNARAAHLSRGPTQPGSLNALAKPVTLGSRVAATENSHVPIPSPLARLRDKDLTITGGLTLAATFRGPFRAVQQPGYVRELRLSLAAQRKTKFPIC